MHKDLVVNPYLSIIFGREPENNCVCAAPKPGAGLQMLTVSEGEQPALYQLFREMTAISLEAADITEELSSDECDILIEHAVLIDETQIPKRVLFSCQLGEIDPAPTTDAIGATEDLASLIVNPLLRFEPFSLENFRTWAVDWHLSPHQPTAWVKNPATGVECGYWLTPSEAECISGFVPGENPKLPDDPAFVNRCLQAGILLDGTAADARSLEQADALGAAREKFAADKYVVLNSLFPPPQMAAIRRFYREYVAQGFMPFGDTQVAKRYRQYNEPFATFIHKILAPAMSKIVGEPVKTSYCYAASYKDGAILSPHTDQIFCEFSISFQVDYEPEPIGHLSPWALHVAPYEWTGDLPTNGVHLDWDKYSGNETPGSAVHLASGDGLVYKGRELVHFRYPLPAGHRSTSLFFHYVAEDFEGSLNH